MYQDALREIIKNLMCLSSPKKDDIIQIKKKIAEKYHLKKVPRNSDLIVLLKYEERKKILELLRRKSVRTVSGVTVVAVMTKPWPCPHEEPCAYCPGGPSKGFPQSYTGSEPAALRGRQNDYDPYSQVKHRLEQYRAIGHMVDKIELIIMGGTFPSTPLKYQCNFIKGCLEAMSGVSSRTLEHAKKIAESSIIRNVGITIETRPDWSKLIHVKRMLSMGVTRVELGVQNVYDDVYRLVNRGHTVEDVSKATKILKDAGLKVVYHMMPGLPGSNFHRDLEGFKRIFLESRFKPDMLKIYPCLVIKGTKIYEWWKKGLYKPYMTDEALSLIAEIKKIVPEWIRIMRIQRDIPAYLIEDGVKKSNLRQLISNKLRKEGINCNCIRCREAGHKWLREQIKPNNNEIQLIKREYKASGGKEYFISAEDIKNGIIIGYIRLRFPSDSPEQSKISSTKVSLIRELRVCGPLVPVGSHYKEAYQHKGWGLKMLRIAEKVSEEHGFSKVLVTSALGTKRYYRKFGYKNEEPYMSKEI